MIKELFKELFDKTVSCNTDKPWRCPLCHKICDRNAIVAKKGDKISCHDCNVSWVYP